MKDRAASYGFVVLVFALSELLERALGIRFAWETLGTLYQYLDPAILEQDLARGLYYLHAQPPLFNLALGLALKAFPASFATVFSLVMSLAALALLLSMAWLMRRLRVRRGIAGVVLLLFALSPNFLVYANWLFYTLPVALMLTAAGAALLRFSESKGKLPLAAFAGLSLAVMMTRSTFHPLWLIAVGIVLFPLLDREKRRALAAVSLVVLFAVSVWFLKNAFLVGSFSGSTWLGLSLTKRWPLSQEEVKALKDSGEIPPYWQRRPFQEPRELTVYGFFRDDGPGVHPALDAPYKSNHEPNFNHRDYAAISASLLKADLGLMRRYPLRYLQRTATAFLLYLQPGPNSVHFLVSYDFDRVHRYRDLLTRYLFLGAQVTRPIRMLDPRPNLFLLVFPLLLGVGIWNAIRAPEAHRALHVYMLVTVLWVTAVSNLVEIGENDRMRWEIEPFLAIWAGCLSSRLADRLLRARSTALSRGLERPELDPARERSSVLREDVEDHLGHVARG
jgi:hypothetical protein